MADHDDSTTVYVTGLPHNCTTTLVRTLFDECGRIEDITEPKEGHAYVTFSSREVAELAVLLHYRNRHSDGMGGSLYLHVDIAEYHAKFGHPQPPYRIGSPIEARTPLEKEAREVADIKAQKFALEIFSESVADDTSSSNAQPNLELTREQTTQGDE